MHRACAMSRYMLKNIISSSNALYKQTQLLEKLVVLVTMNSCTGDTSGLKLYRQFFTHSFGAREDQALSNSTCEVKPSNATSLNIAMQP